MIIYENTEYIKVARPLPDYVERDIFDIPYIEKDDIDISRINNEIRLIKLTNITKKDKFAKDKIVHSLCYDNELIRQYNNPLKFVRKASMYYAIASFDFSMSPGMRFHEIYNATYSNRWIGAFVQSYGKKVIATVGWVGPEYYDITFAGLRDGSVFLISTLGANNEQSHDTFMQGYKELRKRFPSSKLICVGDPIQGMDSDICFIKYEDSFGSHDIKHGFWQPKLVNWDMSLAIGGN